MKDTPSFTPILLGSDMNVYGMARSFHEMIGGAIDVYAREQLAPTRFSRIVNVHLIKQFDSDPTFIEKMREVAHQRKNHDESNSWYNCKSISNG